MVRQAQAIDCTPEQRTELEVLLKSRKQKSEVYLRARMILHCVDVWKISDTAKADRVTSATVMLWKNRYIARGLERLSDCARSGCPVKYAHDFTATILAKPEEAPPIIGCAQWDGSLLAAETG